MRLHFLAYNSNALKVNYMPKNILQPDAYDGTLNQDVHALTQKRAVFCQLLFLNLS